MIRSPFAAACIVLAACTNSDVADAPAAARFTRIDRAQCPAGMEPGVRVLNAKEAAPFAPAQGEAIVALRARPRATSGYHIEVEQTASDLLTAQTIVPAAGTMQAQVITHPCAVIRVPNADQHPLRITDPSGELVGQVSGNP